MRKAVARTTAFERHFFASGKIDPLSLPVLVGLLCTLAISFGVGAITPGIELTPQIYARGQPTFLDLIVALASAAAASYALARPNLVGSIAGVAIASGRPSSHFARSDVVIVLGCTGEPEPDFSRKLIHLIREKMLDDTLVVEVHCVKELWQETSEK